MKKLIIIALLLLASCGTTHYGDRIIIKSIDSAGGWNGYKWVYHVESINGSNEARFYSNEVFYVSDTIKMCCTK